MRLGLLLPSEFPEGAAPHEQLLQLIELSRLAVERGVSSLWALHHHVSNRPTFQPVPLLSALSQVADVTLGTGILVLPLHHPVQVAEDWATLDVLSGGRTVLGVAPGYWEPEFSALGVPMECRGARLDEQIEAIRQLWRGEHICEKGEFFDLRGARIPLRPLQEPGPPIMVGGMSARAIARAARADGWLLPPDLDLRALREPLSDFRAQREELGVESPPLLAIQRECLIARTSQEARRIAEPYLRQNAAIYAERGMTWIADRFERWFEGSYLVGSPAQVTERLVELEELGIADVHIRIGWGDVPANVMKATLDHVGALNVIEGKN